MEKIELNSNSYNVFSSLLKVLLHEVSNNFEIQFGNQNNWHKSHPFYRIHKYKGIQLSQVMGIYLMFNKEFLSQFDTIIEIGTYNGGLSTWIYDNKKENAKLVTYDIDISVRSNILDKNIDARLEDCFDKKTFDEIVEMIQKEGRTLVLCDGGDKPREFREFSKFIKSGDHIMCHDYCKNENEHQLATQFWQWPYHIDTFYKDIESAVIENNLEPFKHQEWQFFLWGSYKKK